MKVIRVDKFDTLSNSAINKAVSIANALGCTELNCSHMMAAVITISSEMGELFKESIGKTPDEYIKALRFQCEKGFYTHQDDVMQEVDIRNVSKPMSIFLTNVINNSISQKKQITISDIYHELFKVPGSEVYETLDALGIERTGVKVEAEKSKYQNILEKMPVTARFANNLCAMAYNNKLDPVEGRDDIIDQLIEVLGRRQKGNPCLIGEPGVGKTAIVEGLAQRIVSGNVPQYMKDKQIINVDISGIVSGARFRGEFEERLNSILYEVDACKDAILFFDEFHMLMEAGGSSTDSTMTAANILKPAISRGDIRIIGATTIKEYSKYIEKDNAFSRRMQSILVDEPTTEIAIKMLKKLVQQYEDYHKCKISDTVVEAAVRMSDRYITDKKLPDKAINVIDDTAARLKAVTPENEIFEIQVSDIQQTISKTTGIDINDIDNDGRTRLQELDKNIHKNVIGQDEAIDSVVKAIRRAKAGIKDPNKPIASFLFVGPTGVGKTELTKAVATEYSGNIKNLIRFDMSEYMEKHSVSKMVGSPPGYVGFGEGGQLTEAVRHNPNSIVLFDEIEKAHPEIFNIMLQILDDGILTDAKGVKVDFKNTIIIMTSNAGYGMSDGVKKIGFGSKVDKDTSEAREEKAKKALEETFRPEFINRLDKIVVFNSLSKEDCTAIVDIELKKMAKRLVNKNITISWDSKLINHILDIGYSEKFGARNIKRKIQEVVEDTLADYIISETIKPGDKLELSYDEKLVMKINGLFVESVSLDNILVKA